MDTALFYEILGYVASILVAISLMMSSIVRLRLINLVGSLFFTAYGLVIGAYPVAAVNAFISIINVYYLFQMTRVREYFTLLEVPTDSKYLGYFLQFYDREIQRFFPRFHYTPVEGEQAFFVLRNMVPAGLFIAGPVQGDRLPVRLDFVIPGYRDFKIARFVFIQNAALFKERGVQTIYSQPGNQAHSRYLARMGFQEMPGPGDRKVYCLQLS